MTEVVTPEQIRGGHTTYQEKFIDVAIDDMYSERSEGKWIEIAESPQAFIVYKDIPEMQDAKYRVVLP